jgi:hypothetical protein
MAESKYDRQVQYKSNTEKSKCPYNAETKQLPLLISLKFQFGIVKNQRLKCHFGTSRWGGMRYLPYVITEQGVAMLSSVLRSKRAIQVNIVIMRAFVKIRQIVATHKDLSEKLNELERKTTRHDAEIRAIFDAIRQLVAPSKEKKKEKIGFI